MVRYLANKASYYNVPYDDLVSAGNIGLIKAIEKYDINYRTKATFQTYAYYWVFQSIDRFAKQNQGNIRVPLHALKKQGSKNF